MQKQPETTEGTRQNLVDAFWKLYTTRRIDKITVREITKLAGYNRSTFYEYFRDVYDVLEYVETQSLPALEELPPLIEIGQKSPALIRSFLELYRRKYQYYSVLLGENGDPGFHRKLKDSLKSTVIQALSNKEEVDLLEIDLMLEYILSGMIAILIYSHHRNTGLAEEQLVEMLYGIMQGDMVSKLQRLVAY